MSILSTNLIRAKLVAWHVCSTFACFKRLAWFGILSMALKSLNLVSFRIYIATRHNFRFTFFDRPVIFLFTCIISYLYLVIIHAHIDYDLFKFHIKQTNRQKQQKKCIFTIVLRSQNKNSCKLPYAFTFEYGRCIRRHPAEIIGRQPSLRVSLIHAFIHRDNPNTAYNIHGLPLACQN